MGDGSWLWGQLWGYLLGNVRGAIFLAAEGYMAMILYERRYVFVAIVMVTYTVWFKVKKLQHVGGFDVVGAKVLEIFESQSKDDRRFRDSEGQQ